MKKKLFSLSGAIVYLRERVVMLAANEQQLKHSDPSGSSKRKSCPVAANHILSHNLALILCLLPDITVPETPASAGNQGSSCYGGR